MNRLDQALGIHPQALQLRARRAEILAANLANADTPAYKARDFDFQAVLRREAPGVRLATTRPGHIQPGTGPLSSAQVAYRVPTQPASDGNTVDPDLEYNQYASNLLEYQASLRFLNDRIKTLKLAIRGQ